MWISAKIGASIPRSFTSSRKLWVNPPLGVALGTPNATVSNISFPGFNNFQTRAAVANAMTLDELRIGSTFSSVTPYTEAPAAPAAPSSLSATANSPSQITLTWTDNATDETGFKLERSLDGSTGWTQIAGTTAAPPSRGTPPHPNPGYLFPTHIARITPPPPWPTLARFSTPTPPSSPCAKK
ncbi:MAG: hypothetical protein H7067_00780 [Burkholderiales bacterium]|nr:hypothetical protein [Opitutaceae bacterium]